MFKDKSKRVGGYVVVVLPVSSGGRFRLEGVWACPPLGQVLWESIEGLYTPLYVGEGSGGIR